MLRYAYAFLRRWKPYACLAGRYQRTARLSPSEGIKCSHRYTLTLRTVYPAKGTLALWRAARWYYLHRKTIEIDPKVCKGARRQTHQTRQRRSRVK